MIRPLLAAALSLALGLSACSGSNKTARTCNATADCGSGFVCADGFCIDADRSCSATSPCPGSLACCGGVCKEGTCCQADGDCNGGYCASGACVSGTRPTCTSDADCGSAGQCLTSASLCVECIATADCSPGYTCSPQHACTIESGCTAAGCAAQGKVCAPEQGVCRLCVSDYECGNKICTNGQCIDCTASNQCGDNRVCTDGSCVRGQGTACASDGDCGGLICVTTGASKTCQPCFDDFECPVGAVCTGNRCFATNGQCHGDSDCEYPTSVCNYDTCVPGCQTTGCATGDICNASTGRCVPFTDGTTSIGDPCNTHADCLTNVCWPIDVTDTTAIRRCGQACSSSKDCPNGFVCFELGDGGTCRPRSDLVGPLDVAPGGTCTDGFKSQQCETRYCNDAANTCYEMCGDDANCNGVGGGSLCVLRRPTTNDRGEYAYTSLCEPPQLGTVLPAGALCTDALSAPTQRDHDKCDTGWCVQTPDSTRRARCAQGCCTPSDCDPSAPICKPIDAYDGLREGPGEPYGFQKTCLFREYTGAKPLGATCSANSECLSEICAQGASGIKRCTQTCCSNTDCAGFDWSSACRPPFYDAPTSTGEEPVADAQFEQLVYALGRKIVGNGSTGSSFGVSPICFPR